MTDQQNSLPFPRNQYISMSLLRHSFVLYRSSASNSFQLLQYFIGWCSSTGVTINPQLHGCSYGTQPSHTSPSTHRNSRVGENFFKTVNNWVLKQTRYQGSHDSIDFSLRWPKVLDTLWSNTLLQDRLYWSSFCSTWPPLSDLLPFLIQREQN